MSRFGPELVFGSARVIVGDSSASGIGDTFKALSFSELIGLSSPSCIFDCTKEPNSWSMSDQDVYDWFKKEVWDVSQRRDRLIAHFLDAARSRSIDRADITPLARVLSSGDLPTRRDQPDHTSLALSGLDGRLGMFAELVHILTREQPDTTLKAICSFAKVIPADRSELEPLLRAVTKGLLVPNGWPISGNLDDFRRHVLLRSGSSIGGLDSALRATVKPGEIVLVPQGSFESYGDSAREMKAVPWYVITQDEGYLLSPKRLEEVIRGSDKTRVAALVLANPTNPFGQLYSTEQIEELGAVCRKNGVRLIIDELFSPFRLETSKVKTYSEELWKSVIVVCGSSKAFIDEGSKITCIASGDAQLLEKLGSRDDNRRHSISLIKVKYLTELAENLETTLPRRLDKMREGLDMLSDLIGVANERLGFEAIRLMVRPQAGIFAVIGIRRDIFTPIGIKYSDELCSHLLKTSGASFRNTSGMLIAEDDEWITLRANYTIPSQGLALAIVGCVSAVRDARTGKEPS